MAQSEPICLEVHSAKYADVLEDMVRVHSEHRSGIRPGHVARISVNGRSVSAVARGAPKHQKGIICMDHRLREKLGVQVNQTYNFDIRRAGWFGEWLWAMDASNAMPRVAARLALLSVVLGLLGLLLGAIGLCIAFSGAEKVGSELIGRHR